MPIDPRVGSPFAGLAFAGELDEFQTQLLEVTMTDRWKGYLNQRVLNEFNQLYPGRLAFLRFIPDPDQGMVIMVPTANGSDYGAMPVEYTDTENGAFVNVRLAVKRCNVVTIRGRTHVFPVTRRTGGDNKPYLAFVVKDAATRPSRQRARTQQAEAASQPTETK